MDPTLYRAEGREKASDSGAQLGTFCFYPGGNIFDCHKSETRAAMGLVGRSQKCCCTGYKTQNSSFQLKMLMVPTLRNLGKNNIY
jgi:hypothetical protein